MRKKNSLIELYRFIFALNVVKNHGYFPYQGQYFSTGRISVEFFFVLSGWFLVRTIDKYVVMPYWKGLFKLLKDKIFGLGIPFLVAILVNIPYQIIRGVDPWWNFNVWGYLWYIESMLLVFIFYYTLKRFVKSKKWFIIITAIVFVSTSIIHAMPDFFAWGHFRAFAAMSLGILISFLPAIKIKKQWLLWIPLACVWILVLRMLLFNFTFVEEEILDLVLFPALIYLTFQLSISNRVFNYLGALSFGLYAYQSIPRLIEICGYCNIWLEFLIIVVATIATDLIKRIIKKQHLYKIDYEKDDKMR